MMDIAPTSPAKRVLLVEAHKTLARLLREIIAPMPGLLLTAEVASGQEALAAAAVGQTDLVILDVHLPDARGLDVVAALSESGRSTKIILLIEEDDGRYHQAAWLSGAAASVGKEHVAGDLAAVIRQVLAAW